VVETTAAPVSHRETVAANPDRAELAVWRALSTNGQPAARTAARCRSASAFLIAKRSRRRRFALRAVGASDKVPIAVRRSPACVAAVLVALVASALVAQTSSGLSAAELEKRLNAYTHLLRDWAGLTRYGSENAELATPAAGADRVVFFGDQITDAWGRSTNTFFPGKPYLNRGLAGQTTAQMLVRFRQDVVALKPKVVIVQGGTNDIASLFTPGTEALVLDNLRSMTEIAKANGIRVIIASVTPVCDCVTDQTTTRPQGKLIGLNGALRDYATESGLVFLDYYAALVNGRDFKAELTADGLLPNDAGYAVMAPLAEQAIARALGRQ
jgi:lysophospholipase L1-like esterase